MDDPDNDALCKAWRLLRDHRDDAESVIEAALADCVRRGDHAGAAEWLEVAIALQEWRS